MLDTAKIQILIEIHHHGSEMPIASLSKSVAMERSSLEYHLHILEEQGFVSYGLDSGVELRQKAREFLIENDLYRILRPL